MANQQKTAIWAHRGFSHAYPENTLPAFQAALELGVDGLEFDIHMTKDGHMVVIHDEQLGRTTNGSGLVAHHTLSQLKSLDAGSWFSPSFTGETIPTLEEVLALIASWSKPVSVNIEIKSGFVQYPGIEMHAFQRVRDMGLEDRVILSSFNHFILRDLKRMYSQANIGLLYMEGLVDPWRYAKLLEASALHPFYISFDKSVVQDAHDHGIAIHTFTANQETDMLRLMDWGVDAIMTDRPDLLLAMQNQTRGESLG